MCAFILLFMFMVFPGPSSTNSDNIALLTGTLKTKQRAACDDKLVSLVCPQGTSISIQVAQYAMASAHSHLCMNATSSEESNPEENCLWPNNMQYSLLQTVVEACQKKQQCKFSTKLKPGVENPCPRARKFVEVAYKCRPHEFRSLTGCQDEVINIICNPRSRIAVFDAHYGRTAFESIDCPQTLGIQDEFFKRRRLYLKTACTAPRAVEAVMQMCHGKRQCQLVVNNKTFQSPCSPETKAYLKVSYACVPLGVITERYEAALEKREMISSEANFSESDGDGDRWADLNTPSPIAKKPLLYVEKSKPDTTENKSLRPETEETTPIVEAKKNTEVRNDLPSKSNLIIYISISVIIIIICVALVATRIYLVRRNTRNSKNGDMFTTEAPNVFNDAVSDIDNDVDVSHISGTFYDTDHPDMILYRDGIGRGTLRAMRPLSTIYPCAGASMYGNVDYVPSSSGDQAPRFTRNKDDSEIVMGPKSLSGYSNSQFYYG